MANLITWIWLCFLAVLHHSVLGKVSICGEDVCRFEFVIRRQRTMTYIAPNRTYGVELQGRLLKVKGNSFRNGDPAIGEIVSANNVLTADGHPRNVITINGYFPGPNIQVMEGVRVEVTVVNELWTEGVTIHWHGMHLDNNLWMDGVPYVTQCPILPQQAFTYTFRASPAGTHWYHSHYHSQRLDGLNGLLVVHPKEVLPPSEMLVNIMDWSHVDGTTLRVFSPYFPENPGSGEIFLGEDRLYSWDHVETSVLRFVSGLVNGRGRRRKDEYLPLEEFQLTYGLEHRFRLIHSGAEYSLEISVDGHTLIMVASDGQDITPTLVHSFIIFPGESMDFVVRGDADPDAYWLRARTLTDTRKLLDTSVIPDEIRAIVVYEGHHIDGDPTSVPRVCSNDNKCIVFNCPFPHYPKSMHKNCIGYSEMHSPSELDQHIRKQYGLDDTDFDEMFINIAFSLGSSINGRRFIHPSQPIYQAFDESIVPCNPASCVDGCSCTNIQKLPLGRTMQIVLSALQEDFNHVAHHSMHLHGYSFAIVGVGYPSLNRSTGHWMQPNNDISCESKHCVAGMWNMSKHRPPLNLQSPIIKDTVLVPARGYVVLRFRANNPGMWLFHCHQELHLMEGMTMLFSVGDFPSYPRVPSSFPTCLPYRTSVSNHQGAKAPSYAGSEHTIRSGWALVVLLVSLGILFCLGVALMRFLVRREYTLAKSGYRQLQTDTWSEDPGPTSSEDLSCEMSNVGMCNISRPSSTRSVVRRGVRRRANGCRNRHRTI